MQKEETNRKRYSVEEYKKITNFKETKEILKNLKLELKKNGIREKIYIC